MAGLESVPKNALQVGADERAPQPELVEVRNKSQAHFLKRFLAAKYPHEPFEEIRSEDHLEDTVTLLQAEIPGWFQTWWEQQEAAGSVRANDDPQAVGDRAYAAYRAGLH